MIGLARDLRGIAFAFNTKVSYMMMFEWIYPKYTPILQRAVEIWYSDPQVRMVLIDSFSPRLPPSTFHFFWGGGQVTTPVLKLFAELVQNRSQRLQFDVSSPNGILLFREASKIICTYGQSRLHYSKTLWSDGRGKKRSFKKRLRVTFTLKKLGTFPSLSATGRGKYCTF